MTYKPLIESTEVIHRTDDGSTITAIRLTPEARAGLSTNGATIRPVKPPSLHPFERLMLTLFAALLVAIVTALWLVGSWTVVIGLAGFGMLLTAAAIGGLRYEGKP